MAEAVCYGIIEADAPQELANEVSAALGQGWVPLGGVTAFWTGSKAMYVQALVRRGTPMGLELPSGSA